MKNIFTSSIVSALSFLTIVGCAHHHPTVNTFGNANQTAQVNRIADQRVITDEMLANTLWLTEIRESKTNDGFKRIQVFFKNLSNQPFSFSYRFNWYDENGVEIEAQDDEMWKKVRAVPGDDVTLTSIAPQQNCGDFKLRVLSRH